MDTCALRLRFIDSHTIPAGTRVDGHAFGGISGIDHDPRTHVWYLVSDDRSQPSAASFFVAELSFDSAQVNDVTLRLGGLLRLPPQRNEAVDAESIRIDRRRGELIVASEGDPGRAGPWIARFDRMGRWQGELRLPWIDPRPNRSIEGLAFSAGGRALWIALEAPLMKDGPPADVNRGADVRLARRAWPNGTTAQYLYTTDAARPHEAGESSDNGISEILAVGAHALLVLERSGIRTAANRFRFHSRLYCVDPSAGTTKRLVFDFDGLDAVFADNLEGMSWGPDLADGRRSLVFVTDNNLFADVPTQLLFFEASPAR